MVSLSLSASLPPHLQGEGPYSSSHSSSNTLSSNASSSHSEERWFDTPDPAEADPDPLAKGGSSDSGIDATSAKSLRRDKMPAVSPPYGGARQEGSCKRRESSPGVGSSGQSRGYHPKAFGVGASGAGRGSSSSNNNQHCKQPRLVGPALETSRPPLPPLQPFRHLHPFPWEGGAFEARWFLAALLWVFCGALPILRRWSPGGASKGAHPATSKDQGLATFSARNAPHRLTLPRLQTTPQSKGLFHMWMLPRAPRLPQSREASHSQPSLAAVSALPGCFSAGSSGWAVPFPPPPR